MLRTASTVAAAVLCASVCAGAAPSTAGAAPSPAGSGPAPSVSGPAPSVTSGTLTFTQTWATPALPDSGAPIAESSPVVATLDSGGPAAVVGDRSGNVYAFHLSDGSAVTGWPANDGGIPIDSTPSVLAGPDGRATLYVGLGDAAAPQAGGYLALRPDGQPLWFTPVVDPASDNEPAAGVQASLTVASFGGRLGVVAGSLDQEEDALDAGTGALLPGWPFFTADSVFSTAAVADLYGIGSSQIVEGGAQTAGFGLGRHYQQGGHLRILTTQGGLVCEALTDQTVDSSPAVGPILAGAPGIVTGTGAFFSGAADSDTVKAYDTSCRPVWSTTLNGFTTSSPAVADVTGSGRSDVVEGTDTGTGGSVYLLDGATGAVLWQAPVTGRVIGSVVTADLTGAGYQDVLVPTTAGTDVLDGRNGQQVTVLAPNVGFQNSPLVTADPNGTVGITLAGYIGSNQGMVLHFEVTGGASGTEATGPGSWPMFHHDPELSGNAGGMPAPGSVPPCEIPSGAYPGYVLAARDGGVFDYAQPFCGSMGGTSLVSPIVGEAMVPGGGGYWQVAADGGVFAFGQARFYGSMGGQSLFAPVVGMAATPDGKGYWLVASDGGIFAFGDAVFYGSMGGQPLKAPVVAIAASPDGLGYRLVGSDGGVFCFGDAQYFGSMGGRRLVAPVVGMADDVATAGYWLVAADGGIFAFGAPYYGSTGGMSIVAPMVAIETTLDGYGYRLVGADGGVFAYGDAGFFGSAGSVHLQAPVVAAAGS